MKFSATTLILLSLTAASTSQAQSSHDHSTTLESALHQIAYRERVPFYLTGPETLDKVLEEPVFVSPLERSGTTLNQLEKLGLQAGSNYRINVSMKNEFQIKDISLSFVDTLEQVQK
ncbi:hypothetical protein [Neptuniibacter sp. QD37_11]|uniref:hypothetical protein n=1 Tax=Neptuniibacter sp. QD37_11 TaxID=3398209 RepID=UPI0039F56FD3